MTPVVEVEGLRVQIAHAQGDIVDEVSFSIAAGEVLGLVGESGSGKTTVGLALLGHTRRGAYISAGTVRISGENILDRAPADLRALRGTNISYVPQDPSASLNPALRIQTQLEETLAAHPEGSDRTHARQRRIAEVLEE